MTEPANYHFSMNAEEEGNNNPQQQQQYICGGYCNMMFPRDMLKRMSRSFWCQACRNFHKIGKRYLTWKIMEEISSKVKCCSTLDCGVGKQIPHHSALIQYDHREAMYENPERLAERNNDPAKFRIMSMASARHAISEEFHEEFKLCRPLCPNCHAIHSRWERKVINGINPDTNGDFEVKTDPELYQAYLDTVSDFVNRFSSLNKQEISYLFHHPEFDLDKNPDFNILEDYRMSKDLFLKN